MNLDEYDIYFSDWVLQKLNIHGVSDIEVEEAFQNAEPPFKEDKRVRHQTNPPTFWFIASTAEGRLLKVVFMPFEDLRILRIKSAYEPDRREIELYGY